MVFSYGETCQIETRQLRESSKTRKRERITRDNHMKDNELKLSSEFPFVKIGHVKENIFAAIS